MDIDKEIAELSGEAPAVKPKKPKAAKKPKPAVKKAAKPKAKKAKKTARSTRKRVLKAAKKPKTMAANARTERLDMRLTKGEKAKVHTRAAKLRRTVTSIVIEAIEKIK